MIGKTVSHYRILEKIGEGGMGQVYRAHDERLDRDVALKVLPTGLLADEAAGKRFRKEALALAKLNHPHIASVHDFDTQGDVDFLVMEYIPGVSLSEKVAAGPLPEKELLQLATQCAQGTLTKTRMRMGKFVLAGAKKAILDCPSLIKLYDAVDTYETVESAVSDLLGIPVHQLRPIHYVIPAGQNWMILAGNRDLADSLYPREQRRRGPLRQRCRRSAGRVRPHRFLGGMEDPRL